MTTKVYPTQIRKHDEKEYDDTKGYPGEGPNDYTILFGIDSEDNVPAQMLTMHNKSKIAVTRAQQVAFWTEYNTAIWQKQRKTITTELLGTTRTLRLAGLHHNHEINHMDRYLILAQDARPDDGQITEASRNFGHVIWLSLIHI